MGTIAVSRFDTPSAKLIAPWWHTVLLVTLFLGMAVGGAFFQRHARSDPGMLQQHPHVASLYLSLIIMEWGLFVWVWRGGLGRTATKVRELIGGTWANGKDVLVDTGLALGLWAVWTLIEMAWNHWFGAGQAASIQTFLPQRAIEILLWIGVFLSAGFCEELVFRGYFQRQFQAFTHSRWIALLLQAALFGISHGYQGVEACVKITCYGALFGLLAIWRGSLRPGMLAHASLRRARATLGWQRWLFALGITFTALSLTSEISFEGDRIKEFHLLMRDFPFQFRSFAVLAIACWIGNYTVRRRLRTPRRTESETL